MVDFLKLAQENQARAHAVIQNARIYQAWESVGATVNLIGSLKTGLLMTHLDIDFHIYTPELNIADSFQAISLLAQNKKIKKIVYANLLDDADACLEWHAWYEDDDSRLWQIDMMHIVKGSAYDGFFENIAARLLKVMTPAQKETILRLKFETPETEKIAGIEYCRAVLEGGVKTYDALTAYRAARPMTGICDWTP